MDIHIRIGNPVNRRLPSAAKSTSFTVMTYNIRYEEPSDGPHLWSRRRLLALEIIRAHHPDLFGVQEPTEAQWRTIAAALPRHASFGAFHNEWDEVEPHGGFFRAARFTLVASGIFWLSDTPSVANSVSWPNDWGPRACGWVKLQDRLTTRTLLFASTHLDTNTGAWLSSARVLHAELDRAAGDLPVILVGDFNCAAGSAAHRYLCDEAGFRDAWREVGQSDDGVVTFNGFTPLKQLPTGQQRQPAFEATPLQVADPTPYPADAYVHGNYRIDWILLRGPIVSTSALIDYRTENGLFPSDHYPVVARIRYA